MRGLFVLVRAVFPWKRHRPSIKVNWDVHPKGEGDGNGSELRRQGDKGEAGYLI